MKKFWNRKGFTLTELCVVMGVVAIVGTMVTTTTIFFSQQNNDIQAEAAFVSEVTAIQKQVNDWLKKYDNDEYAIYTDPAGATLMAQKDGAQVSQLTFSENSIVENGSQKSNAFSNVSAMSFTISEQSTNIVEVTISAKKGSGIQNQVLLFPLFSRQIRNRSVTGRNG